MKQEIKPKSDVFGEALWNHFNYPKSKELITWTDLTEEDPVPLSYFFRGFMEMPKLEQHALELTKGKTLDIGCGSGCHSLYLQNEKEIEVTGIDNSRGAIKTAKKRGVKSLIQSSIFDCDTASYDTLLLLMNGPGICGRLEKLGELLLKLKSLLSENGQILLDSSDLIYLFDETPEGEKIVSGEQYYGELDYGIRFEGETETFPWLYVDFGNLSHFAKEVGLKAKLILEGENWDYLARLTREY
jgi:SAM-dependent methyltransferase